MNEPQRNEPETGSTASKQQGSEPRSRPRYDAGTSESTREMRDTSRRRRDAEEKLQQHLLEAKDHVPHEHHPDQPSPGAGHEAGTGEAETAEPGTDDDGKRAGDAG